MNPIQNRSKELTAIKFIAVTYFLILVLWWFWIWYTSNSNESQILVWISIYQLIAILGGIAGFIVSKLWGGLSSLMGKAIFFLSLGLLSQAFGQTSFSYFIAVQQVEIPYPSIADLGYIASTLCYIFGTYYLAKAIGVKLSSKSIAEKLIVIGIPLLFLIGSYFYFLQGYEFDWSDPLRVFLDYAYPLGDAIYVSIALSALLFCKNYLGGIMKWPLLFVLFAMVAQYIADFNFLYQAYNMTWINGSTGDLIYMTSHFISTLAILKLGATIQKIRES